MQPNVIQSDESLAQESCEEQKIVLNVKRIDPYTTLLQSGIYLESLAGQSIGFFLNSLPGFDMDYIINRIQTIFLDGNAIDDMETVFNKTKPVLAISAAMPGLAGVIFRKKSLHAALRTSSHQTMTPSFSGKKIIVRLKLFNMIAAEKGAGILHKGGVFNGSNLLEFFQQRPLLKQNIVHIELNTKNMATETVWAHLSSRLNYHVTIKSNKDTI